MREVEAARILSAPLRRDAEQRRWYCDGGHACIVWTVRGRLLEPLPTFSPSGYRLLAIDASLGEANQFAEVHGYHHLRTLAHKPSQ